MKLPPPGSLIRILFDARDGQQLRPLANMLILGNDGYLVVETRLFKVGPGWTEYLQGKAAAGEIEVIS